MKLQEIVKTSIPKNEIGYCESAWADGDLHVLCSGIQWNCLCLKEVQNFLDRLNEILLPMKNEIDAGCDGTWEIRDKFAVATWDWTEQGFKVKGALF